MPVTILSSSPNTDGLTAACVAAARDGLASGASEASEVRLTDAGLGVCRQCDSGWGTCLHEHVCQVHDGFAALHRQILESEAVVIVTPVYWGEASESMKAFLDRLRRCEATRDDSVLRGKRFLLVAAAGGTGGGLVSCLAQLERFVQHVGASRYDLIGVTRWTREAKLSEIERSAAGLAESLAVESV
jgi:multimeric flavodoxin WrbA